MRHAKRLLRGLDFRWVERNESIQLFKNEDETVFAVVYRNSLSLFLNDEYARKNMRLLGLSF